MRLTVPEVLPLVLEYVAIPGNESGGNFHIVLDDGNIKDSDIQHCIQRAKNFNDHLGVKLGECLLNLSKTQRKKIYALRSPSV